MKRKGPPYEIKFGVEGQIPPAYVCTIREDRVVLDGAFEQLDLNSEIEFAPKGRAESNSELVDLMLKLNARGVVFSYDPKSMISPSWFMASLQDQGVLLEPYKEISWPTPKSWLLTTYELA
tara:strand:+ start:22 stop:384 length:363 start_codon:yes stop_codon:yes gene_type:complete